MKRINHPVTNRKIGEWLGLRGISCLTDFHQRRAWGRNWGRRAVGKFETAKPIPAEQRTDSDSSNETQPVNVWKAHQSNWSGRWTSVRNPKTSISPEGGKRKPSFSMAHG